MKKVITFLVFLGLLSVLFLLHACEDSGKTGEYGSATLELIGMVENDPQIRSLLVASIKQAKQINPDRETNPVQTLEEYYDFVSWAERSMPWTLLKSNNSPKLYENIIQSLCYFNFLNNQPLPELEGKGYLNNSLQYVEPYSTWLTSFNKAWGKHLDSEDSWNESYHQLALQDDRFGLGKGWYEDPSHWKTFNQFFMRHLASPDQRPIASPDDPTVVVSPADAVPQGVWRIDSNSNIITEHGVTVKSATLTSIEQLIGEGSAFGLEFANGTFTHSFLNVTDYHRYHFPLDGVVREVRIIPAHGAVGAIIQWDAKNNRYAFDPSRIGWQSLETRGCVILETEQYGLVALLPVGMAQVGSVNFEDYIKEGIQVKKGDMLGYFLFGGSDFIMLFQEKAGFVLDAPKSMDQSYKHLLMGERIGYLEGNEE